MIFIRNPAVIATFAVLATLSAARADYTTGFEEFPDDTALNATWKAMGGGNNNTAASLLLGGTSSDHALTMTATVGSSTTAQFRFWATPASAAGTVFPGFNSLPVGSVLRVGGTLESRGSDRGGTAVTAPFVNFGFAGGVDETANQNTASIYAEFSSDGTTVDIYRRGATFAQATANWTYTPGDALFLSLEKTSTGFLGSVSVDPFGDAPETTLISGVAISALNAAFNNGFVPYTGTIRGVSSTALAPGDVVTATIDNFSASVVVPEPGSLAFVLLGGLALVLRRCW